MKFLIIEELEQQLLADVSNQVPIPVWSSAIVYGMIPKLGFDFRKKSNTSSQGYSLLQYRFTFIQTKESGIRINQQCIRLDFPWMRSNDNQYIFT
jgi:hypothetical protein